MKKAVILEDLGKCFLIAFLNNASPDKLINQIFLYLKCSYCEPNLSFPNKKKGRLCGTRGFTTAKALSQICFGFLLFILQQRGLGTKLLITEWTAVMSPDATGDFLILDQNNHVWLEIKKTWANSDHMVWNSISSSFFPPSFLSFKLVWVSTY